MESSSSSSIPNSSAAEEPDFVAAGNALLPKFKRGNFSTGVSGNRSISHEVHVTYVSVGSIMVEFQEFHKNYKRLYNKLGPELSLRVVCYLLGLAYTSPKLSVVISSRTWLEPICVGLTRNPTEVSLDIKFLGSDKLLGDSLQHIAPFLLRSKNPRDLQISSVCRLVGYGAHIARAVLTDKLCLLDISGIETGSNPRTMDSEQVAEALIENNSIKILRVSMRATSAIVRSFASKAANDCVEDLTLLFDFGSEFLQRRFPELEAVLTTKRRKLRRIHLLNALFSQSMWMQVLNSLKGNTVLEVLDIGSSRGWMDKQILGALLNVVRVDCPQITDLGLHSVSQNAPILREALPALHEQLRLNTEYRELKRAPTAPPRSARVVLCGPGYAGKTTFCRTMIRNHRFESQIDRLLQKSPRTKRFLYGPDADKELHKRTRGVDMHLWRDMHLPDLRITLWDFAGQKEYYALHQYLFPNVNSANLFLFFFSLVPDPYETKRPSGESDAFSRHSVIERELLFWLRFLCSNSKEVIDPKPRVRIIITNQDRVDASTHVQWRTLLSETVNRFKARFGNRLDLVHPITFLNAHSKRMVSDVESEILNDFEGMIPRLEPTFAICEEVRRELVKHMSSTPVLTLSAYENICLQVDGKMLRGYETRQAVASYLHNVGEIIYIKALNFIVIDPRWLGVGVLGNLLNVFGRRAQTKSKGLISRFYEKSSDRIFLKDGSLHRAGLEELLLDSLRSVTSSKEIGPDDFIKLLCALEICYEDDRGGYLIPATMDDIEDKAARGLRKLQWRKMAGEPSHCTFIGRRLQCADQDLTVLTPGFFPRLQVVLRKYLEGQKLAGQSGFDGFEIDRNLLRFSHNAMDIIIEYGEGEQYQNTFVDVLVRTKRHHTSTVDFIQKHVLDVIRKFCAQPGGNQGVILVEGVIRSKSVEHLVQCRHRENQAILISELEEHLKDDVSYRCSWSAVSGYVNRPGIDLGEPEEEYALDAINGRGFLENLMRNQMQTQTAKQILVKLNKRLRTVPEQGWSDTPKFLHVLKDDRCASSSQSEVRLRLHLGCEHNDKPHFLVDQKGRSFVVEGEVRQTLMPLLQWAYKLAKVAGTAVSKSVPFWGALEVGLGMLPSEVPTLAPAFLDKVTLKKIGIRDQDDIVSYFDALMKASPCCDWLIEFLDLQRKPQKFLDDFGLYKMRYKDTQMIAFLCGDCRIEGLSRDVLQPP